jgi:hypothetical protein
VEQDVCIKTFGGADVTATATATRAEALILIVVVGAAAVPAYSRKGNWPDDGVGIQEDHTTCTAASGTVAPGVLGVHPIRYNDPIVAYDLACFQQNDAASVATICSNVVVAMACPAATAHEKPVIIGQRPARSTFSKPFAAKEVGIVIFTAPASGCEEGPTAATGIMVVAAPAAIGCRASAPGPGRWYAAYAFSLQPAANTVGIKSVIFISDQPGTAAVVVQGSASTPEPLSGYRKLAI